MNRTLLRHGFVLIVIALVSALFVPALSLPRLGVSAHTIGILSGTLLIAIGGCWSQFILSPLQARLMAMGWIYSSYANWLGCWLGAMFGAGRMTPVASAGAEGSAAAEALVATLLISVAVASLIAVSLSIWGLRGAATAEA